MSVTVRPYVNGGWEVDIRVELPDGTIIREQRKPRRRAKLRLNAGPKHANGCCWSTANLSGPRRRRCSRHQHSRNSRHDSWTATRKPIA